MNTMENLSGRKPAANGNALVLKFIVLILIVLYVNTSYAQNTYSAASIHSHNDYAQPHPFYNAYAAGVGAIEADIYLRNGQLMVAHSSSDIKQELTLKSLYIDPLQNEMRKRPRQINLLIDLKESYSTLLPQLIREVEPLMPFIKPDKKDAPVCIVITGNRPPPAEYNNYPSYLFFDDDLQIPHNQEQWKRVKQVSLNFELYSKWKGEGVLPFVDERLLKAAINAVHRSGKKIRFWGAPDNPAGWQKLMSLGADILCTDKVGELTAALNK